MIWRLDFYNGTSEFNNDATLTGQQSGAQGVIVDYQKLSGLWDGTASGWVEVVLYDIIDTFGFGKRCSVSGGPCSYDTECPL